jgi:hypothetical protein
LSHCVNCAAVTVTSNLARGLARWTLW